MSKFENLYKKNKEIINYIIFGVLTTIVNFIVYFTFTNVLNVHYIIANSVAWFLSVLFAYVTNRLFVFEKVNNSFKEIFRETILFFVSRLVSGILETLILILLIDIMNINSNYSKILVAVIVVILNYVFSKLIVFRKYQK